MNIPDEAVEAYAQAFYGKDHWDRYGQLGAMVWEQVRAALAAALPHLRASCDCETEHFCLSEAEARIKELEDKLALREAVNTETAGRWRKAEAELASFKAEWTADDETELMHGGLDQMDCYNPMHSRFANALRDARARIAELEDGIAKHLEDYGRPQHYRCYNCVTLHSKDECDLWPLLNMERDPLESDRD